MTSTRDRHASLGERVYRDLRDGLMSGTIAPTERLGEERLAQQYRVSRTPVREALARLQSDGLVERRESGLFPYRPRLDTLDDHYELRVTLEITGIARIIDDPDLAHDRAILIPEVDSWRELRKRPPEPDAGFVAADEQFHTTLLASSGNLALVAALHAVNATIRPVRMFDYLTHDRMMATIDEHVEIGQAVLDRELTTARAALLTHIDKSRSVVVDRAAEAMRLARMGFRVDA